MSETEQNEPKTRNPDDTVMDALHILLVAGDQLTWLRSVTRDGLPHAIVLAAQNLVKGAKEYEAPATDKTAKMQRILEAAEGTRL